MSEPIHSLPPFQVEQVMTTLAQTIDWGVDLLGLPALWQAKGARGKGVRVAILDTGASPQHPDLLGAIVDSRDFTGSGVTDRQGHSTHCSGILAARDNTVGVVGVAPEAELLIGKVLGDNGSGSSQGIAAGIHWAIGMQADIISMSLGSSQPDQRIGAACAAALAAGIYVICAAGNEGPNLDTVGWPASFPGMIAVGSIDRRKQISRFSSRGNRVDIVAPGDQITSCWINGGYSTISGTSMACPFVSGVVALYLSVIKKAGAPVPTPAKLVDLLHRTAVDLGTTGPDPHAGFGLIDPTKLLEDVVAPPPPSPVVWEGTLTAGSYRLTKV